MKRRIIQASIIIIFMLTIFTIALQTSKKDVYIEEKIEKIADITIETTPEPKSEKQIKIEESNSNINDMSNKLDIINSKYELLKNLIPEDYKELDNLTNEIQKLNDSINDNIISISNESDISQQTIDNLNTISNSLNELIEVFGNNQENQITGTIEKIEGLKLYVLSDDEEYIINVSDTTAFDGKYEVGVEAIFVCDNIILADSDNYCVFFIQK